MLYPSNAPDPWHSDAQVSWIAAVGTHLFENVQEGLLIVDPAENKILAVNTRLCALLGIEKSVLVSHAFSSCFPTLWQTIQCPNIFPLSADQRDCSELQLQLHTFPFTHAQGSVIFCDILRTQDKIQNTAVHFWHFWDVTAQKQAQDTIQHLSHQVQRIQEKERQHLAQELHDSTAQILTILQMKLKHLELVLTPQSTENLLLLQETQALVQQCHQEIRTIAYLLHPPFLGEGHLHLALSCLFEEFSKRTGLPIIFTISLGLISVSDDVERACFRILQEALTNSYRHAQCTQIVVSVQLIEKTLHIKIQDNGKGIPQQVMEGLFSNSFSAGMGLRGIKERLTQLQGRISITPLSSGTCLQIWIPLS